MPSCFLNQVKQLYIDNKYLTRLHPRVTHIELKTIKCEQGSLEICNNKFLNREYLPRFTVLKKDFGLIKNYLALESMSLKNQKRMWIVVNYT